MAVEVDLSAGGRRVGFAVICFWCKEIMAVVKLNAGSKACKCNTGPTTVKGKLEESLVLTYCAQITHSLKTYI